jgi:hypothetical protein
MQILVPAPGMINMSIQSRLFPRTYQHLVAAPECERVRVGGRGKMKFSAELTMGLAFPYFAVIAPRRYLQ